MGFTIDEISGHKNTQNITIYFDTVVDFNAYDQTKLEPGSVSLVLQDGSVSILSSTKQWIQQ